MKNEANAPQINSEQTEYLGAFLNIARHNMFMLINHLTERFDIGCKKLTRDEDVRERGSHFLKTIFNPKKNIPNEVRFQVLNYINKRHHLPLLEYFELQLKNEPSPNPDEFFKKIHVFLETALNELSALRDSYSHYLTIDRVTQTEKEKKKSIDARLKKDLIKLFAEAPVLSRLRNVELKESDYEHMSLYEIFEKNSNNLTKNGLFFFTCLFLERNSAIKFLKKFSGFKNETIPPFRATLKTFCAYTITLPSIKIGNENKIQSLLMEMLTELSKCPKELFNYLSEDDKSKFEAIHDEVARENVIFNSTDYANLSEEEIEDKIRSLRTLKRSSDRFSYFALRYIDEMNIFQNICFQVTLGKAIVKDGYEKEILGEKQPRQITKTINVFGKLSGFENNEDKLTKHLSRIKKSPFIFEQFAPHYNISNNKIGLFYYPKPSSIKLENCKPNHEPTAFLSINDLPKLLVLELLEKGLPEKLILDFIKTGNQKLFDEAFLNKIKLQTQYDPPTFSRRFEDHSKKIVHNEKKKRKEYATLFKKRHEHLNSILEQYQLSTNQLPTKVLDFLMDIEKQNPEKSIHNSIKTQRRETQKLINKLKKELVKEKEKQNIKLGELATYLARDIIDMIIDKDLKQKITSPYYNKLQNKIAYFSASKKDILALLDELQVFHPQKGHVFLTKNLIQNQDGLINFYMAYLQAKQGVKDGPKTIKNGWFDSLLVTTRVHGKQKSIYSLSKRGTKVPYSLKRLNNLNLPFDFGAWLNNKAKMPINLPNNLFDNHLNILINSKLENNAPLNGFSVLLEKYVQGDTQPFYKWPRLYDKYIGEDTPNKRLRKKETINKFEPVTLDVHGKSIKEIVGLASKKAGENEKTIRFYQTKDRVLKLLSESIIKSDPSLGLEGKLVELKNIHPNSDANPLDYPVTFYKKVIFKGKTYTITGSNSKKEKEEVAYWLSLSPEEKSQKTELKKWYTWTVKDFGRFNRYLHDLRLPDLLEYFEDPNHIPFELLEYELKRYDVVWDKMFAEIFKLEKTIATKDRQLLLTIHQKSSDYDELQFKIYVEWLKTKNIVLQPKLSYLRNKFSHSQFPEKVEIKLSISKKRVDEFVDKNQVQGYKNNEYLALADQFYNDYTKIIEATIEEVLKC